MKKNQTSQLVLGAVLLAIFIVLHIIIPGGNRSVQSALMVITHLPITFYVLRCEKKFWLVMVGAGAALSAILLPPVVTLSYAIPGIVIGVVFGVLAPRVRKSLSIAILSLLHFLQNIFEILLYYKLMDISFSETWAEGIDKLMQLVRSVTSVEAIAVFAQDVIVSGIPAAMIAGAVIKGMASFLILKLVMDKLSVPLKTKTIDDTSDVLRISGRVLSGAYLAMVSLYGIAGILLALTVLPYGKWFAASTAFALLGIVSYLYYFYIKRIRKADLPSEKVLVYSGLLVLLLPVNIFALPVLDLYLINREARKKTDSWPR